MDHEYYAEIFKAVGHPVRIKIVAGLMRNEKTGCNVNKMVEKLGLAQSTVSQHLGVLRRAGIIVPKKSGVETCYKVVDPVVRKIIITIDK